MKEYTYQPPPPAAITAGDVYGKNVPEIPKGYRFLDFRPPNQGEYFVLVGCEGKIVDKAIGVNPGTSPRLIVERVKRLVFEATGEHRLAEKNEYYRTDGDRLFKGVYFANTTTSIVYDIYRLIEE